MTRANDILINMTLVRNSGFWNNSLSFSDPDPDPDMDKITFELIAPNAFSNTRNKKIRTLERPHSLMFDIVPSPPRDMMNVLMVAYGIDCSKEYSTIKRGKEETDTDVETNTDVEVEEIEEPLLANRNEGMV